MTRRWLGFGALGFAAVLALAPRPPADNSLQAVTRTGDAMGRRYADFVKRFGEDHLLVVELEAGRPSALVEGLTQADAALAELGPIRDRLGPVQAYPDELALLEDPELYDDSARTRLAERLSGPLGQNLRLLTLTPPSGVILARADAADAETWRRARGELQVLAEALAPAVELNWFGTPLLNLALGEESERVERRSLPGLVLACLLGLGFALRSFRSLVCTLLPVGLGILAVEGAFGLLGGERNLIVDISKPLALVILLATSVHVVLEESRLRSLGDPDSAWRAAREKGQAVLLALLTTGIGFASLALSDLRPIQQFGLLTAAMLGLGAPLVLLATPALLERFGPPPKTSDRGPNRLEAALAQLGGYGERWRTPILLLSLGLVGAGAILGLRGRVQTNPIRFFPIGHPLREAHDRLGQRGTPLFAAELLVEGRDGEPPTLDQVDAATRTVCRRAEVTGCFGPSVVIREANHRLSGVDRLDRTAVDWFDAPVPLDAFTRGHVTRTTAFFARPPTPRELAAADREAPSTELTGAQVVTSLGQARLTQTLIVSLALTVALVELVIAVALRSTTLALVALLPNLVPLGVVLLAMRALDLPFDLGTTMVFSLAVGIAVDDTLHYLVAWRQDGSEGAIRRTGRAILLSSLVISAGFFALVPSDFLPTRYFAGLTGLGVLSALLGDLVVLPALLGFVPRGAAKWSRSGREAQANRGTKSEARE